MTGKVVTVPIVPELPVGAVFQFQGKKTRYRVVEVSFDKVVGQGYSVCDDCAFQEDAEVGKFTHCNSFVCAGLDRKDRTYVRAERITSRGEKSLDTTAKKNPDIVDVFRECGG